MDRLWISVIVRYRCGVMFDSLRYFVLLCRLVLIMLRVFSIVGLLLLGM